VIRRKAPLLIEKDLDAWTNAQEDIDSFPVSAKCWLGTPILLRNGMIGVIGLYNFEQEEVFDKYHRDLLVTVANTIASQVTIAIENAQLIKFATQSELLHTLQQITAKRKQRLELLQQISKRMAEASLDPDEVLELVARVTNDATSSDLTSIYRYDQEASSFTRGVRVSRGRDRENIRKIRTFVSVMTEVRFPPVSQAFDLLS